MLKQNQFEFDEHNVLDTIIMGDKAMYECYAERNRIYALPEMSEDDGMKVAQYEADYSEMDGYEKKPKQPVYWTNLASLTNFTNKK